jgi:hypothetical protein
MSALRNVARDEKGLFSFWRREQPKRPLKDSELSAWVCRVLMRSVAAKAPVSVRYRPATAQTAEAFTLLPTELFARGSDVYVEGMVYPTWEIRELRVERIFDARIERPNQAEEPVARGEVRELRPRRAGALDPGQYAARDAGAKRGGHRTLTIAISLLIVAGGVLGGFEFLRRFIGF